MINSRDLQHLSPNARAFCTRFLLACSTDPRLNARGATVIITCTYRDGEAQAALYAQGRTKPGKIVTNAKPGESRHNATGPSGIPASEAFDVLVLRHGKPVWGTSGNGIDDDPTDDNTDDLELWQIVGSIGEECGLEWAGRWVSFREFPHFQTRRLHG